MSFRVTNIHNRPCRRILSPRPRHTSAMPSRARAAGRRGESAAGAAGIDETRDDAPVASHRLPFSFSRRSALRVLRRRASAKPVRRRRRPSISAGRDDACITRRGAGGGGSDLTRRPPGQGVCGDGGDAVPPPLPCDAASARGEGARGRWRRAAETIRPRA
jgi:hypothetical protein